MNARQKAKKYKKELDALKKSFSYKKVVYKTTTLPTEHFGLSHIVDREWMMNVPDTDIDNTIRLYLSDAFAKAVKDKLIIKEEHDPYTDAIRVTSDIFVSFVP